MTTFNISAGERTRIIWKLSNSIPTTYEFFAFSPSGNDELSGTIVIKGSNWLFPKPPVSQKLAQQNTVSKTMWDTFYSVYVTSDQDVQVTLGGEQINRSLLYIALVIGITATAASLAFFGMS